MCTVPIVIIFQFWFTFLHILLDCPPEHSSVGIGSYLYLVGFNLLFLSLSNFCIFIPLENLQIWERLRGGLDEGSRRTTTCPTGLHPDGMCSCDSLMAEESSTRASISRIVMLAEALFEVVFS